MSRHRLNPESVGIIDPTFATSTEKYQNSAALADRKPHKGIFASLTDTGAANAMMPPLEILSRDGVYIRVLAREAGGDVIKKSPEFQKALHQDPRERIERIKEAVVFTGMSSNPSLELLTNQVGNEKGKIVAAIEDYPGAYGSELKKYFEKYPLTRPNRLLVMNDWAKIANLAELPWLNPDHVFPIGQPAFDYIATEDRAGIKASVYDQAGIENSDKLVVWMGQKGGTKEAFEMFIDGAAQIPGDFRLAIRRHPRDVVPMDQYEELAGPLKSRLVRTDGIPTAEVGAAADYVATIFSTEGLSSVMRGIPTLHILDRQILALTEVPGIVVPVVDASHVITDASQSRLVIASLFNERANQDLQGAMAQWKPDGKAAERVAKTLISL